MAISSEGGWCSGLAAGYYPSASPYFTVRGVPMPLFTGQPVRYQLFARPILYGGDPAAVALGKLRHQPSEQVHTGGQHHHKSKNASAKKLGRKGGKRGGKRRAESLTGPERSAIARQGWQAMRRKKGMSAKSGEAQAERHKEKFAAEYEWEEIIRYGQGEQCKPGETAAKTGCTPVNGEPSQPANEEAARSAFDAFEIGSMFKTDLGGGSGLADVSAIYNQMRQRYDQNLSPEQFQDLMNYLRKSQSGVQLMVLNEPRAASQEQLAVMPRNESGHVLGFATVTDRTKLRQGIADWVSRRQYALFNSPIRYDKQIGKSGKEGRYITIGSQAGSDGEKHGGSRVFIEDGKITKGPSGLAGKSLDDLDTDTKPGTEGADEPESEEPAAAPEPQNAAETFDERQRQKGLVKIGKQWMTKEQAEARFQHRREMKEGRKGAPPWARDRAQEEGINPEHLEQSAQRILAADQEVVTEKTAMLQRARKHLASFGGDWNTLLLNRRVNKGKEEGDQASGLDEVANDLASTYPEFFDADEDPGEQLYEMLTAGNPQPMDRDAAYSEALNYLIETKPEDPDEEGDAYEDPLSLDLEHEEVAGVPFQASYDYGELYRYEQGQPCKPGERADKTGCTPDKGLGKRLEKSAEKKTNKAMVLKAVAEHIAATGRNVINPAMIYEDYGDFFEGPDQATTYPRPDPVGDSIAKLVQAGKLQEIRPGRYKYIGGKPSTADDDFKGPATQGTLFHKQSQPVRYQLFGQVRYAQGQPCAPGERADLTGCTPRDQGGTRAMPVQPQVQPPASGRTAPALARRMIGGNEGEKTRTIPGAGPLASFPAVPMPTVAHPDLPGSEAIQERDPGREIVGGDSHPNIDAMNEFLGRKQGEDDGSDSPTARRGADVLSPEEMQMFDQMVQQRPLLMEVLRWYPQQLEQWRNRAIPISEGTWDVPEQNARYAAPNEDRVLRNQLAKAELLLRAKNDPSSVRPETAQAAQGFTTDFLVAMRNALHGELAQGGRQYSIFGNPVRYACVGCEESDIADLVDKHGPSRVLEMVAAAIKDKSTPLEGTKGFADKYPLRGTAAFARMSLKDLAQVQRLLREKYQLFGSPVRG